MDESTARAVDRIQVEHIHETHVDISVSRVDAADPDAVAYLWVCACGDGGEEFARGEAVLEARRHERRAG